MYNLIKIILAILYQDLGRDEEALVDVSKAIEINEQFS